VALKALGEGEFEGTTHADYANMVGPYGGITAAVLLNAACLHPQQLGDPLAITVNYAGPVADGPFRVVARPVRTNRSTQHWFIEQWQGDAVCTTATALFGKRRETWTATEALRPAVPPADDVEPRRSPIPLAWMQRYELRPVVGGVPDPQHATPQTDSITTLWIRDHPARPLDALSLVALSDNFYPRVYRRLGHAVPAGTISMTTYLHADAAALATQGERPVLAFAWGQQFGGGYFDQSAQIWAEQGGLLASSHQLVYFKD
jgi:acyl-CoA thioesterase